MYRLPRLFATFAFSVIFYLVITSEVSHWHSLRDSSSHVACSPGALKAAPEAFPAIKLNTEEAPWFILAETNAAAVLDRCQRVCIR